MAIAFRYVDRMGFVVERLIDIVHVQDTSALSLKGQLSMYLLNIHRVYPMCADNVMMGQKVSHFHSIHCFAHQLQLTLVAVSKKCIQVGELVLLVSNVLNVLGASFKRMDKFRDSQKKRIQEVLDMGELTTACIKNLVL
ncbi:hypothetical protein H5410_042326 [Solanum commersonii]|uniref:DUF4371 domain-containing protein n=1 Tax=Solanum commersonii TaxID=4109 RepID=A0A9J5XXA9_SOLCO|nr:hypothetical protein H5410_042326 [Solanum commersonii]